ncbi:MAG TPA: hypothetical protein PL137_05910 [Nocardioides sp.]|nr:hypothetical protein [Nocardioides sp.]
MNLPEQPPTFRPPTAAERPWVWRLEDASGATVDVPSDFADRRFSSQADAESWVGEIWSELAGLGVDAVTLMEADRVVYGPMSLSA